MVTTAIVIVALGCRKRKGKKKKNTCWGLVGVDTLGLGRGAGTVGCQYDTAVERRKEKKKSLTQLAHWRQYTGAGETGYCGARELVIMVLGAGRRRKHGIGGGGLGWG